MYKHIKYLTENNYKFNPVDYEDDSIVDTQIINKSIRKYQPQNRDELEKLVLKRVNKNPKEPYLLDIDTSKITDMSGLFIPDTNKHLNYHKIEILDLSTWDTSNVTEMHTMFYMLDSVKEIDISTWNVSNVTKMFYMFQQCESLTELDLSGWNVSDNTNINLMFFGCDKLKKVYTNNERIQAEFDKAVKARIYWEEHVGRLTENNYKFNPVDYEDDDIVNTHSVNNIIPQYFPNNRSELKKLIKDAINKNPKEPFLLNIDTSKVTNMASLFINKKSIEILDLSTWDISDIYSMNYIFYGCENLKELYLPNFDISAVGLKVNMFGKCNSLELDKIYTNDKRIKNIFLKCQADMKLNENLHRFDVSDYDDNDIIDNHEIKSYVYNHRPQNKEELIKLILERIKQNPENPYLLDIDTIYITDMRVLFNPESLYIFNKRYFHEDKKPKLDSIKTLDLSTWDTSNVIDMFSMFKDCQTLKELNLSGWDTSNVRDMNHMFYCCRSLIELNLSHFNTYNVTNMSNMFDQCRSLKKLNLSNWDTSNVTDMFSMFGECTSLTRLDLSSFNTKNVTNMAAMFMWDTALKELDISNFTVKNISLSNCTKTINIFCDCNSLKTVKVNDETLKDELNRMRNKNFERDILIKNDDSLYETINNFNPVDYNEDPSDIIDGQTSYDIMGLKNILPKFKGSDKLIDFLESYKWKPDEYNNWRDDKITKLIYADIDKENYSKIDIFSIYNRLIDILQNMIDDQYYEVKWLTPTRGTYINKHCQVQIITSKKYSIVINEYKSGWDYENDSPNWGKTCIIEGFNSHQLTIRFQDNIIIPKTLNIVRCNINLIQLLERYIQYIYTN